MTASDIKYNYFHWGPFLFHTKVSLEECKMVEEACGRCRKESLDNRVKLAGHIREEYNLGPEANFLAPFLKKYFEVYVHGYNKWRGQGGMKPNFQLKHLWVNYMKANEFNPPHDHGADLSFVFYPHMPKEIIKECESFIGTMRGPGGIAWFYGDGQHSYINTVHQMPSTGDFFIFPAHLKHWVFPFKSEVTRISVSGNIVLDQDSRFSYFSTNEHEVECLKKDL